MASPLSKSCPVDDTTAAGDRMASKKSSTVKTKYLLFYNFTSATLWSIVLGGVAKTLLLRGPDRVFDRVGGLAKWTQTLAALEVAHSVLAIVRAAVPTTLMQVGSRFLLVWGVVNFFPAVARSSRGCLYGYTSMLLAWSAAEIIRHIYFVCNLAYDQAPEFLTWLRYSAFFVLYPLGISSECWLMWLAMVPASARFGEAGRWFLRAVLGMYVPGIYILFTHMIEQRRKIIRGTSNMRTE